MSCEVIDLGAKRVGTLLEGQVLVLGAKVKQIVSWLLNPRELLAQRVIQAGFWALALRIVDRVFALARIMVLAQVLSPNDFGLFGIALLALSALETFSQTGFEQALVQRRGDIEPYLDSVWTVQVMRGLVLALIVVVLAPYVAMFFEEPAAALLLRVLALSMVFRGLTNVGVVYFQKDLEFSKQFAYMVSGTLVDLVMGISAAFLLRNAWALAFGHLAGNFVRMVVSYIVHHHRPSFRFQAIIKVKELFSFGSWIWGTGVIGFLALQADKAVVGKVLGAAGLGFYDMASQVGDIVAMDLGRVASAVGFPAYSMIQDQPRRLKRGFVASLEMLFFISLPFTVITVTLAPELVNIFLGDRWSPIVRALQFLTIAGLIRTMIAPCGGLCRGVGRPDIEFWLTLVRTGVMLLFAVVFSQIWGIAGVAVATLLGVGVTLPIWWYLSLKATQIRALMLLERLVPTFLGAIVMASILILLKASLNVNGLLLLINVALMGAVAYLIPLLVVWRYWGKGPVGHILALVGAGFSTSTFEKERGGS